MARSASAASARRFSIISRGFRLSDSEMMQKSCPSGAPIRDAGGHCSGNAGLDDELHAVPCRIFRFVKRLHDCRSHGEDTGISRRNHGDMSPGSSEFECMTRPLHFFPIISHMNDLIGAERTKVFFRHPHIGLIAENVFGLFQFVLNGRRH